MYTDFALVYDRLMSDVPYQEWARYYAGLLELYGVRPNARCVECACGTGSLTIPLAQLGFSMTGMDLSEDMLNLAQQKARGQGVMIPFIRLDMRKLAVQRPVDAVLATCDGVNYLTAISDLTAFFRSAYSALKPGGILAFDVSTPYKLSKQLGDKLFTSSQDDLVYVWQGEYAKKQRILNIHLDVFAETQHGLYRRIQEDQKQRGYTQQELREALAEAQFTDIRFFGDRTFTSPEEETPRWHVAAQRSTEP